MRVRGAVAALAVGAGLALAAAAPAAAGIGGISATVAWSTNPADAGSTVTLAGTFTSNIDSANFGIRLSVAGGPAGVIASFTTSANLASCTLDSGLIITCNWPAPTTGGTATITATVNVPANAAGQAWQGDASTTENMGLDTEILEIVAPPPTTEATTTTTAPATTVPGETPTTVEATTTTAAASGGGTATTRPRAAALPATGSTSSGVVIAAMVTLLAGVVFVLGARRRRLP